jgi:hypothetical protein
MDAWVEVGEHPQVDLGRPPVLHRSYARSIGRTSSLVAALAMACTAAPSAGGDVGTDAAQIDSSASDAAEPRDATAGNDAGPDGSGVPCADAGIDAWMRDAAPRPDAWLAPVTCAMDSDCVGMPRFQCNPATHLCAGCIRDSDCTDPLLPRCDLPSEQCVGCETSADCAHFGSGICDTTLGWCVTCTAADQSACGGNGCNLAMRTCTTHPPRSVPSCGRCDADMDCASSDERCVGIDYGPPSPFRTYCLRRACSGCAPPFASETTTLTAEDPESTSYCVVDVGVTTCEAVRALVDHTSCTTDDDCGVAGHDDGVCDASGHCASRCATDVDCPSGLACGASTHLCGAP